ncbi:hypothetical protein [uncultured Nostoc sp.]|uniref:hypothetical protein n=1 Tax=uncultured Nostoc sp. TaxID=340711 RepID=UPI0035CA8B85
MLYPILPNYVVLRSPLAGALHHRVESQREEKNTRVWEQILCVPLRLPLRPYPAGRQSTYAFKFQRINTTAKVFFKLIIDCD